ncbi:2-oxo-4-hydroxy-4-carboxy-5-ureidoimidazoline decarboxylase [Myxococcus llanfairpwllgwyngyllgogerychwyrndrobwllllantysiliogogogochensis]|uniref:2-oxo-4-hydroxy-4-carboxy-5-ureidoimidazoline decarboxylase n=1 Tax=Myxococcus llanfairpwllgwyngyllgogerychwyrndrobwllllantysiliogogogochensis TaxID=2590453 RepID=A0A540X8L4_9BACT|nr:2-oxo-4-hydroxy-4-carboxy-5-ureidoimidazoline decarboxylase [Myxococcus llanfairpwllgwyngyllgogerychwyrndrobwllllantysiliogogogochensis]TQF17651.1 2-oxo-4-hydroxy-4-carboxy-5-ureidoimidazoline decarboxylase [Myxococcus llanfairpwllgwyngyllgogerychwyrndrobwllllantysiliogogogochensis]
MSALHRLNTLAPEAAREELLRCCGSSRWVEAMVRARPFRDVEHVLSEAGWLWEQTGPDDWHEAFKHHPRIGDVSSLRAKFASTATWSSQEQGGVNGAAEAVIQGLADGNKAYEERFGFIFLVCATGKSAEEMLGLLRARLGNPPDEELRIAAGEQAKITRIRLEKLLAS